MKILHIITGLGQGGAEILLLSVCEEHKRIGNTQKVIYLTAEEEIVPRFHTAGIDVSIIAPKLNTVKCIIALRKEIREFAPDVIHTHLPKADALGRIAGITSSHCKIISTIHSCDDWKMDKKLRSFLFRAFNHITINCFRRVGLIAVSEQVKQFCVATEKISPKKILTLPNFASGKPDKSNSISRQELGIPDNAFLFVNVGRLVSQKNQMEILRAASRLKKSDAFFLILGEGRRRHKLEAFIKKEHLTNVLLCGYVENIYNYYLISNMALFTSRCEGQPIAMLEAMQCRLPILSSDIDAVCELNKNGECILTYKEGDCDSLCNAIMSVLTGKTDYNKIAENAYILTKPRTAQSYVRHLMNIYQNGVLR